MAFSPIKSFILLISFGELLVCITFNSTGYERCVFNLIEYSHPSALPPGFIDDIMVYSHNIQSWTLLRNYSQSQIKSFMYPHLNLNIFCSINIVIAVSNYSPYSLQAHITYLPDMAQNSVLIVIAAEHSEWKRVDIAENTYIADAYTILFCCPRK